MKFNHTVKYNGKYYSAGTEVPTNNANKEENIDNTEKQKTEKKTK